MGEKAGRMRILLAVVLTVVLAPTPARAADSARDWLERAADPQLGLREREFAARQTLMLADASASILIAAVRGEGSDSGLRRQVAARLLGETDAPGAEAALLEAAFDRDHFLAEAAAAALANRYSRRDPGELYTLLRRGVPAAGPLPEGEPPGDGDWLALSLRSAAARGRFRALVMRGLALKYARSETPPPVNLAECIWDGLLDADPQFRLYSVQAAAVSASERAAERVAAFLYAENDPKLLAAALRAMAAMRPPAHGRAVERHVPHADPMVSLEALAALDAMGRPGVLFPAVSGGPSVAAFVGHPSTPVRRRALAILAASKNPAVLEFLQAALFDRVAANRAAAARALGELGFSGAVGALHPLLRDPRAEVRLEAAVALGKFGVVGVSSAMLEDLRGDSLLHRRAAAEALGRMGEKNAAPALAGVLDDPDVELACLAAEALGRLDARNEAKALYAAMTATPHPVVADTARQTLATLFADDPGMTAASWKSWAGRNGF